MGYGLQDYEAPDLRHNYIYIQLPYLQAPAE